MGDVIGDLNSRRGQIQGTEPAATPRWSPPSCRWPTCSATSTPCGPSPRAAPSFTMQYDHYEPVPQAVADEVIKKYA